MRASLLSVATVSYGSPAPAGETWKQVFFNKVAAGLDQIRVHFLDQVPYPAFIRLLKISGAHVYLTYPFILSWSLLEALSAGCLVIGSQTGPVEEVIWDRENGLLVDFFDAQRHAKTVADALAEPAAYRHLRTRARTDVMFGYDLQLICLQHVALVERHGVTTG